MHLLNCKMCGGELKVSADMTVATCLYCGSTMTLPKINTEKKARIFNRANQYRFNYEFDKAYEAYQTLVDEDETEAEGYWGMILSEYGVEYIQDQKTQKRIPTCRRTQIASVQSTVNYRNAIKYADAESRMIYRDEAAEIDRIQKSILTISSKEEPFDVFICYKDTETSTETSTGESYINQNHTTQNQTTQNQITQNQTTQNQTSQNQTSQTLSTPERTRDSVIAQEIYEELTKQGIKVFFSRITLADKLGQDYEPYIFSALQSAKVMLLVTTSYDHIESTWVKNEWSRYLQFMKQDSAKTLVPVYKDMQTYELPDEISRFQGQDYNKVGALQDIVHSVKKLISERDHSGKDQAIEELLREKELRDRIQEEKDQKRKKLLKCIKIIALSMLCLTLLTGGVYTCVHVINPSRRYAKAEAYLQEQNYDQAIATFTGLGKYKDSEERLIESIYQKAGVLKSQQIYDQAADTYKLIIPNRDSYEKHLECLYLHAQALLAQKEFDQAISMLNFLGEYNESQNQISSVRYQKAAWLLEQKNYEEALSTYRSIEHYQDVEDKIVETHFAYGKELLSQGDYFKAKSNFLAIADQENADQWIKECNYQIGLSLMGSGEYQQALYYLQIKYKDSQEQVDNCWYHIGMKYYEQEEYLKTLECFEYILASEDPEVLRIYIELAMQCQLNMLQYCTRLDRVIAYMQQEQLYQIGTYLTKINEDQHAKHFLERCILYRDSAEKCGAILLAEYQNDINKIYGLASGETLLIINPALGERAKYAPAMELFVSLADPIYQQGKYFYDKKKWGSAYQYLQQLGQVEYLDAQTMLNTCISTIEKKKTAFNGIWINTQTGTTLKFENGKAFWTCYSYYDPNATWYVMTSTYDADAGVMYFYDYNYQAKYKATVKNNTVTITWIYVKGKGTSKQFGESRTLTRYK